MTARRPLIVFDVNETLIDIDALEPLFERIFATKGRMREWFAQLILYSQALSLTGDHVPFGELGAGVLRMLGTIHDVAISEGDVHDLAEAIANMPVHAEVPTAMRRLKDAGCTLVTLTNSSGGSAPGPLEKAGLDALFARRFTVEPVRAFKPAPATYRQVADAMDAVPAETWLIAAHFWDTLGAQSFGWNAALVTRGVNAPIALDDVAQPTVVGRDLTEVADAIIAKVMAT